MSEYTPTMALVKTHYVVDRTIETDIAHEAARAEFDRWLAAHDRAVKAGAWDEGYRSGHSRAMRYMSDEPGVSAGVNPYRDEATE